MRAQDPIPYIFWSPPLVFAWMGAGDNKKSLLRSSYSPQDSRIGKTPTPHHRGNGCLIVECRIRKKWNLPCITLNFKGILVDIVKIFPIFEKSFSQIREVTEICWHMCLVLIACGAVVCSTPVNFYSTQLSHKLQRLSKSIHSKMVSIRRFQNNIEVREKCTLLTVGSFGI